MSAKKRPSRQVLNLKSFQEILERTHNILERRLIGRIHEEFDKRFDSIDQHFNEIEAKLDDRPTRREVVDLFDRYMDIHQKKHEKIEERLTKIETTASSN